MTLTYGRNEANDADHERSQVLTYSDFQKFMKRLRFHGYTVRYLAIGEYGSQKGRAHWHPILFFYGKVPDIKIRENFQWDFWPWGHVFADKVSYAALRYSCKYVLKDMKDDKRQAKRAMSKKPPLGTEYFKGLARRYVEQGLAPQDLSYSFPEHKYEAAEGWKPIKFFLKGKSAEIFLREFIDEWARKRPNRPRPASELVDLFEEWGRVVRDEDKVWENRVESITTHKLLQDYPRGRSVWAPLAEFHNWWQTYWERWPDGEERQRQRERDEWEYYHGYVLAIEQCTERGAQLDLEYIELVAQLLDIFEACEREWADKLADSQSECVGNIGGEGGRASQGRELDVWGEGLERLHALQSARNAKRGYATGRDDLPPEFWPLWDALTGHVAGARRDDADTDDFDTDDAD